MQLEFDSEEWETLRTYINDWDEWRRESNAKDMPSYTDETIYLAALTIALLRSEKRLEKLTRWLIVMTGILTVISLINVLGLLYQLNVL